MSKILSVVIPTHNRSKYAEYSINSIVKMNLDIELVVSDTSEDDKLKEFIESLDMSTYPKTKLNFYYNKKSFDMTGNHNFALSKASGKYVCLIGDDDSVSKDIVTACLWMEKNNVKVLSQLVSASYVWPDFKTKFFGNSHAGRLYMLKDNTQLEKLDSKTAYNNAMINAAQGTDGLPKLYHGIVDRDLLIEIKNKSGDYVHGASPDFSAAIALSCVCDEFYQTTYPITIPGASGGSNTGRSALNKHKGDLTSEAQTKNSESSWEQLIPSFFSVETVWSDACFKTLKKMDVGFYKDFNFIRLYALLKMNHPDRLKDIDTSLQEYANFSGIGIQTVKRHLRVEVVKCKISRLKNLFLRALKPTASGGKDFIENLQTVETAPIELEKYLSLKKTKNIFLV